MYNLQGISFRQNIRVNSLYKTWTTLRIEIRSNDWKLGDLLKFVADEPLAPLEQVCHREKTIGQ